MQQHPEAKHRHRTNKTETSYYFFRVSLSVIPASGCIRKHIQSTDTERRFSSRYPAGQSFFSTVATNRIRPQQSGATILLSGPLAKNFSAPSASPVQSIFEHGRGDCMRRQGRKHARHGTKNTNNIRRIKRYKNQ